MSLASKLLRLVVLFGVCWAICTWLLVSYPLHQFFSLDLQKPFHAPSSAAASDPSSLPRTVSVTDNDSFSACLLVMDDNHWAIEWLAYHYHALPLRRLIVGVDPRSETSPSPILERWKDRIEITEWRQDEDYMTPEEQQEAQDIVRAHFGNITDHLVRHRARQRVFYYKCLKQLKQEGRTLTLLTDTDEFLRINHELAQELHANHKIPTARQPASIRTMLEEELQRPGNNLTKSPCIQIPRLRFGALENENNPPPIPKGLGLNSSQFLTQRWTQHAAPDQYVVNKISKVVIDVSQVAWNELVPVESIHRPIKSLCGRRKLHIRTYQSVLVINHYLGSLEQYQYRSSDARMGDAIRSQTQYNKVKNIGKETNVDIQPWLQGFVDSVGLETAKQLLEGVGLLQSKDEDPNAYLPPMTDKERCAILLFGLPRSFSDLVLPSMETNLILPNARYSCDYFVHYYYRTEEPQGRANQGGIIKNPKAILAIEDAIQKRAALTTRKLHPDHVPVVEFHADTEDFFWAVRNDTIQKYRTATAKDGKYLYFPWKAKSYDYPSSLDNIVRQWHSIDGAWHLMEQSAAARGIQYQRVGMFRSDVMYISPIDLYETEHGSYDTQNSQAVLAPFGAMPVNDRMFYGPYEAVEIWATKRFQFIERHIHNCEPGWAMHSEKFLDGAIMPAIRELGFSIAVNPDICFLRARADHSVVATDCHLNGEVRGILKKDMKEEVENVLGRNCSEPHRISVNHISLPCEIDGPETGLARL